MASVIEEIINRLLQSAVSDMASTVRLAVLKCLRSPLDYYLSQEHHIESIMFLLADEVLDVRIEALTLLGRLAPYNPSKVLPGCRQILLHVIGDIRSSSDNRTKEEATLVCHYNTIIVYFSKLYLIDVLRMRIFVVALSFFAGFFFADAREKFHGDAYSCSAPHRDT